MKFNPVYLGTPLDTRDELPAECRARAMAKHPDLDTLGHHLDLAFRSNA